MCVWNSTTWIPCIHCRTHKKNILKKIATSLLSHTQVVSRLTGERKKEKSLKWRKDIMRNIRTARLPTGNTHTIKVWIFFNLQFAKRDFFHLFFCLFTKSSDGISVEQLTHLSNSNWMQLKSPEIRLLLEKPTTENSKFIYVLFWFFLI